MNPQPKPTISKTETENKISDIDPALVEGMLRYPVPYANERFAFIAGANWKEQHSYSEQEVLGMLETLKYRCLNSARIDHYGHDAFRIDNESITDVEYTDLLNKYENENQNPIISNFKDNF